MKLDRRTVLSGTAAALPLPLSALPARADAKRQSLVDSEPGLRAQGPGRQGFPDAAKLMPKARAVLIMPELVQGGFFLGAAGGRGVLMTRNGGQGSGAIRLLRHGLGQRRPAGRRQGERDRVHHPDREGPARHARPQVQVRRRGGRHHGRGGRRHRGRDDVGRRRRHRGLRQFQRVCSPAPRSKAPTSTPTTTGTRSTTARARPAKAIVARPALHQSRRRADPPVLRQVVS